MPFMICCCHTSNEESESILHEGVKVQPLWLQIEPCEHSNMPAYLTLQLMTFRSDGQSYKPDPL